MDGPLAMGISICSARNVDDREASMLCIDVSLAKCR
jgi:hypothetical protein